jgi:hypothetical protein
VLAPQDGDKILLPERVRPWCEEVSDAQVAALAAAGYDVEGSLDDLRCRDSAFAPEAEVSPSDAELSSAAVGALVEIVAERARARRRRARRPRGGGLLGRVRRVVGRRGGASWSESEEP